MSRSLIYVVNYREQTVNDGGQVSLGNAVHRFGCNLTLSNDAIIASGIGYYTLDGVIVATPSAAGTLTATLYKNGVAIPGGTSSATVADANTFVSLPLSCAIREKCICQDNATITCVLSGVASTVSAVSLRVIKE